MSIRIAVEQDIPAMLAVYAPYVTDTAISFEYSVPTLEEFTARFRHITAQYPWLVWEENGQVLGYVYGSAPFARTAFQWCAEASIYLAPEIHGRGIGKRLYAALEAILQQQGYRTVYAIVTTDNLSSIAFHKAVGYHHLAVFPDCGFKLGTWHSITWLEKPLNAVEMPTNFPVCSKSIVDTNQKLGKFLAKKSLS